ncbi:alpha-L-arabinofuranosidase [Bacteroidia bacterium]|nr:alpha-L-arabinofuranosidase [Bacteroidia bacterium]GHT84555.1 alpha-L-arabinofuranosidase [Bacteroidia bacterium]GHV70455.1 alpha-L-arabinofuranosidase [Bacteroidia bacterium]
MKKIFALLALSMLFQPLFANEPDSAYIFAYEVNNGLSFAWSIDQEDWHSIGPEHKFLSCDYGRWGSEKKMHTPFLSLAADGLWHCIWSVNDRDGVLAHTASKDLIAWQSQSYKIAPVTYLNQLQIAVILNQPRKGTAHKVAWTTIDNLINEHKRVSYNNLLWSENAKGDPERFASLKPVDAVITVDNAKSKKISDKLIGIFFEDINYAADGGLYAELIQNRDFEYTPEDNKNWNATTAWHAAGTIDTLNPIHPNNPHYIVLKAGDKLINDGFDGIPVKAGEKYDFSVFAKGKKGKLLIQLIDNQNNELGKTELTINSDNWKKYESVLIANKTVSNARLQFSTFNSQLSIDLVSLFPQKTFKNRKNGLRADLAQIIADMQPKFVRFPGGCVAHGDGIENIYRWENTIGALEARVPQRNIWGYHQTAGLGYFEYFQFCEDIGAEPLPVVAAGVPCQNSAHHGHPMGGQQGGIPMEEMGAYIQSVLDLIEWANGDAKTTWGKKRAEAGHPKPFNLKYLGVGNEDLISDVFEERFTMIYNAIKEKHPEIVVVGTAGPFHRGSTDYTAGWNLVNKLGVPMVDEHYYESPGWFIHNQDYYDSYNRSTAKVYLGEYAAHLPGRPSNIETALAEALHLTTLERNGDVVSMASYAPLLAKEGHTQWNPDLIYFNNTEIKPTVGYFVQKLYGENAGDEYLPGNIQLNNNQESVKKRIAYSVVRDSKTNDVIIKLVNLLPVEVKTKLDIQSLNIAGNKLIKTVLTGKPDDKTVQPVQSMCDISDTWVEQLPAYSFTVIRVATKKK